MHMVSAPHYLPILSVLPPHNIDRQSIKIKELGYCIIITTTWTIKENIKKNHNSHIKLYDKDKCYGGAITRCGRIHEKYTPKSKSYLWGDDKIIKR
jgi:hypothetical protein